MQSWTSYHQFECANLDVLHSVGVAHLALRIILVTGLSPLLKFNAGMMKSDDEYKRVFDLMTHADNLEPEDLFQYAVTAVLLGLFLEQRTKFFFPAKQSVSDDLEQLYLNKENNQQIISALLLRHIMQLVCNGHAIYDVGICETDLDDNAGPVVTNSQFRIATAIYSSASMMNHSCDPTIINSFYNQKLIVRAIKAVESGSEIFNCYGPHFRHHTLAERQEILKAQYHFVCDCNSCRRKDLVEFQERFSALRCHHCGGPIQNPASEAALNHSMPCFDCGKVQVSSTNPA